MTPYWLWPPAVVTVGAPDLLRAGKRGSGAAFMLLRDAVLYTARARAGQQALHGVDLPGLAYPHHLPLLVSAAPHHTRLRHTMPRNWRRDMPDYTPPPGPPPPSTGTCHFLTPPFPVTLRVRGCRDAYLRTYCALQHWRRCVARHTTRTHARTFAVHTARGTATRGLPLPPRLPHTPAFYRLVGDRDMPRAHICERRGTPR